MNTTWTGIEETGVKIYAVSIDDSRAHQPVWRLFVNGPQLGVRSVADPNSDFKASHERKYDPPYLYP